MSKLKLGIKYNQSNEEYHSDNGFKSSSQLKELLNDPVVYHKKYVLKKVKKEEKACYDVGNAWHTKILEPHLFDKEYAMYDGMRKGDKWKLFEAAHKGKTILANKSIVEFNILCEGIKNSKIVKPYLEGKHEVSIYVNLEGVPVKVRFDVLNNELQFGADPKSTTGDLTGNKGLYACRQKIAGLDYDLSAALYMDAYNELISILNKKLGTEKYKPLTEWYWIFASKDYPQCRTFRATKLMLKNGRTKYKLALELLKKYEASNWELETFEERVEDIDPLESDLIIDSEGSTGDIAWK